MPKAKVGRILVAAITAYAAFGCALAVTEWLLSAAAPSGAAGRPFYFVADPISQCAYLVGAGYLCCVLARRSDWPAIAILMAIGLLVGTLSLITSWNREPHWYDVALITTYVPCVWIGRELR
jgi:hypothetical protein